MFSDKTLDSCLIKWENGKYEPLLNFCDSKDAQYVGQRVIPNLSNPAEFFIRYERCFKDSFFRDKVYYIGKFYKEYGDFKNLFIAMNVSTLMILTIFYLHYSTEPLLSSLTLLADSLVYILMLKKFLKKKKLEKAYSNFCFFAPD